MKRVNRWSADLQVLFNWHPAGVTQATRKLKPPLVDCKGDLMTVLMFKTQLKTYMPPAVFFGIWPALVLAGEPLVLDRNYFGIS